MSHGSIESTQIYLPLEDEHDYHPQACSEPRSHVQESWRGHHFNIWLVGVYANQTVNAEKPCSKCPFIALVPVKHNAASCNVNVLLSDFAQLFCLVGSAPHGGSLSLRLRSQKIRHFCHQTQARSQQQEGTYYSIQPRSIRLTLAPATS